MDSDDKFGILVLLIFMIGAPLAIGFVEWLTTPAPPQPEPLVVPTTPENEISSPMAARVVKQVPHGYLVEFDDGRREIVHNNTMRIGDRVFIVKRNGLYEVHSD